MSAWTCRHTDGKVVQKIVPPRPRIPWWKGPGADSEEKQEPASDINTALADSLKVLDLKGPIREADINFLLPWLSPSGRFAVRRAARDAAIRPVSTIAAGPRCCVPRWRRPSSVQPTRLAAFRG